MSEQEENLDMFGFSELALDNAESTDDNQFAYPKVMMKMYRILEQELKASGQSSHIALEQLNTICKTFGGIQIYLSASRTQIRDIKIWREFDGNNVAELALKYQTSSKNIYLIIKKMREKSRSIQISPSMAECDVFDSNQHLFTDNTQDMYLVLKTELAKNQLGIDLAYSQLVALSDGFGGKQIYTPTGKQLEGQLKKYRIWQDYNGHNVTELSEKYKVSMNHIWRILAYMRALTVQKLQMSLF